VTMKRGTAGHGIHSLTERKTLNPKWKRMSESVSRAKVSRLLSGASLGRVIDSRGYARIKMICHPRRDIRTGYVYEHIVAAEICLGRPLNIGEIVHHHDEDKSNSHYSNLLVFPSQSDHAKFHGAVRRGMTSGGTSAKLFGGVQCKKPSIPDGGPHWMIALRGRILETSV